MKFFLDSADLDEIKAIYDTGLVSGVTTNPTLLARTGHGKVLDLLEDIADVVPGPVSAEVTATDYKTMHKEAEKLSNIAKNIIVKVPLTIAGLKICEEMSHKGMNFNVTLCFTPAQALLAAQAGAAYVSPFMGRLDDIGQSSGKVIADIMTIYRNYPDIHTGVLAASIRSVQHVVDAALAGAEYATVPAAVFRQMYNHPLTDKGLDAFLADWKNTGQSIV